uniref:Uncharacterized protein n=1 Tax=Mesocestoides corti TaxID=53468 RepID=A0A5K3FX90_MESCO
MDIHAKVVTPSLTTLQSAPITKTGPNSRAINPSSPDSIQCHFKRPVDAVVSNVHVSRVRSTRSHRVSHGSIGQHVRLGRLCVDECQRTNRHIMQSPWK